MGPLFPRLHVNDTVKGGPRAPPRNKMALYEQFSVASQRFDANAPAPAPAPATPWQPRRPTAGLGSGATSSTSASQVGGNDRCPLSFCVPSTEPVCSADHKNTNSSGRAGDAATVESDRKSTQLKSKDTYAVGPTVGCSSQHIENGIHNLSGKKLANDDDFTVPSVLYSGMPPHSTKEMEVQENLPYPTTSPYKNGSAMSKSSSKCYITDQRHLEGIIVSDKSRGSPNIFLERGSPNIKEKEAAKTMRDVEIEERTPSFQTSKEKFPDKKQDGKCCGDSEEPSKRWNSAIL